MLGETNKGLAFPAPRWAFVRHLLRLAESFTRLDVKTYTDVIKIADPQKYDYNGNNCNSYTLFYYLLLIFNNDIPAWVSHLITGRIMPGLYNHVLQISFLY